jgi:hypothetical protein
MAKKILDPNKRVPSVYAVKANGKAATGRPSDYDPKYCQEIIDFFSIPPYVEKIIDGRVVKVNNRLPAFHVFASKIGVGTNTLLDWCNQHEEFSIAYKKAKELQKYFLIENGLNGIYAPAAFCFVAKNITDMRDKQDIEHSGQIVVNFDKQDEKL